MRKTAVGVTPPPRTTKPDRRTHRDRLSPGRLRARKQIRPRPGDAGRAHWPGVTDRGPTPRDAGRPRRPARTARGSGATGEGSGVLHEVRGFVQYAQPLASTPLPSCSIPEPDQEQPSVHSADISAPAVETPDTNRWNLEVFSQATRSVQCSCPLRGHLGALQASKAGRRAWLPDGG